MPRTDMHFDAMLRHLGAAYYESLHGRATQADVMRALDAVEQDPGEGRRQPPDAPRPGQPLGDGQQADGPRRPRGWSHKVGDVMTTSVISVDRLTPYKEIARVLADHQISGVPVLKMGREVAGVVTEADLLDAQARVPRRLRSAARLPAWLRIPRHSRLTAGELMTSPAVTIGPHATVPAAARLMSMKHVRRLPVTNEHGTLVGIVSRRDLLSVFLRPDEDIEADVRRIIDDVLLTEPGEPGEADVAVRNGIVTLTGTLDPRAGTHGDLVPVALRLMWGVDGVVDIVDRLGEPGPSPVPSEDGPAAAASQKEP